MRRLEVRQRRLSALPEVACVPGVFHVQQSLGGDAVLVFPHFELVESAEAMRIGKGPNFFVFEHERNSQEGSKRHGIRHIFVGIEGILIYAAEETSGSHKYGRLFT